MCIQSHNSQSACSITNMGGGDGSPKYSHILQIELRTFNKPEHSVTTRPRGTHCERFENMILKPFPLERRQRNLYKVDRALLNMNSKIFFRRMTVVLTVKTQLKRISSHLKNGNPTKSSKSHVSKQHLQGNDLSPIGQ